MGSLNYSLAPGWERDLAPSGNPPAIGWAPELHGPDGQLVPAFTVTRDELLKLAWWHATQFAACEYAMREDRYDPVLARRERFSEGRLQVIAGLVGEGPVQFAMDTARAMVFGRVPGPVYESRDHPDFGRNRLPAGRRGQGLA